ncbi:type II toxin-antitoxin system VapC family toxin [Haladaptatus halobius]|uniref:type II toxin-antitoxin system VapC family toxin n=1 Tax=Haladaptatus halobius TaxID=2884875 RepID=UPI002102892E|nr:VapC toxin family PIN domain ribonuclease [Haladaptatus halobius]
MNHEKADAVFDGMAAGGYGPVFNVDQIGHTAAVDALSTVRQSQTFNILPVGKETFETVCEEFERYDDQPISFIDQTSAVLAREHEIKHMFAIDSDFRTLGFERVPVDREI